jgi:membrane associated rhomboid family serine protease
MIPLRDTNPSRTVPYVTYSFIAINVVVFLIEILHGQGMGEFIAAYGLVPYSMTNDFNVMGIRAATFFPLLTSMFLHGGWMHLIGNMLFLYIFGDNVEDRFGHLRYFFFYIIAGVAAALTQVFMSPQSEVPMVGASGAIAGVLGSYVFMFPKARILTLIPIIFYFQVVELPAFLFLGIWFLMQIFSGVFSLGIGGDAGGVAWWAHIGGFVAGVILFLPLRKSQ